MAAEQRAIDARADVARRRQVAEVRQHIPVADQDRGDHGRQHHDLPAMRAPSKHERRDEIADADPHEHARNPPVRRIEVREPGQERAEADDDEPRRTMRHHGARSVWRDSVIDTPTMKRKNGKIRSVGVQPFQSACSSGQYIAPHVPGLLTMVIPAMVMPRNASSDISRSPAAAATTRSSTFTRTVCTIVVSVSTLAELLAHATREGELYGRPARRPPALLRVRPLLSAARRRDRRLQGALQRTRPADGAVGLRRRRAVRSDREEAVLSRASRRAGVQLRHAGLRPALRLLPELGHVAGAARSRRGRSPARGVARRAGQRRPPSRRARRRQHVQRAAHHQRVGGRDLRASQGRGAGERLRLQRQRHAGGARFSPALGGSPTRSISRASTTATIGSSADASPISPTRSA